MSDKVRFLIPDGYSIESRNQFDSVGMTLAGQLYGNLVDRYLPGAEYDIWFSSDPGATPPTDEELSKYAGVIWPGCNLTIYHNDDPRVQAHKDLCLRAYEAGIPQIGSCWGIQLGCWVAGGTVEPHPRGREMGIATKIMLTDQGRKHPMMQDKPVVYSHFVSHDDQVVNLPEGATLLAGNDWSVVQAVAIEFKKGIFWGMQYHPEYNLHEVARLILAREERLIKQGWFADHDDMMQYVEKYEAVHKDPTLKNIRWQLKIDDGIVEDSIRECEFINWINWAVLGKRA